MPVGHVRSLHRYPVKSMAGESLDRADVGEGGLPGDRAFALRDERAGEIRGAKKWPELMLCSARYREEPTPGHTPVADIKLPDGTETNTESSQVSQQLSAFLGLSVKLCPLRPAWDKEHYRRVQPGAGIAGVLARSSGLRKVVSRLATLGPGGEELRRDFGREADEPMPDLSVFPAEIFQYVSPPGTYFDAFPIHIVTTASLAALKQKHPQGDWDARRFRPNFVVETVPELSGLVEEQWAGRTLRMGHVELECVVATPRCSMVMQAQPGLAKDTTVLRTIVREAKQNVGIYARVKRAGQICAGDAVELL